MTRPPLSPDGDPARLLRWLYRQEHAHQWPTSRPFGRSLRRLIALELVAWPSGTVGTLTEAGRAMVWAMRGEKQSSQLEKRP